LGQQASRDEVEEHCGEQIKRADGGRKREEL
jgi:hypothetical protein